MNRQNFDVVIVGAGVVGTAIARELSHYRLDVALLESSADIGDGTSKANTAILHTGFDTTAGTLESRLVSRGYALLSDYAGRAGIPVVRTGALLVAWTAEELKLLGPFEARAAENGYHQTRQISAQELYAREPHLGAGALGGLDVPGESIICPWTTSLAYATEAVMAGVTLMLDTPVTEIVPGLGNHAHTIRTTRGTLRSRWLVNAAGLYSDEIDRQLGHDRFTIVPRRGELIVFDKLARPLINHILLPVPGPRGKGVLVAPTVFGNVLLGPTAEDLVDKTATDSSQLGLLFLAEKGRRILPSLMDEEVTAVYAGLRAATEHSDYQINCSPDQRYVCVGGIRSTGLTSSMAIAEYVTDLLSDGGLSLGVAQPSRPPRMPTLGENYRRPYQSADLIAEDPSYGQIVCHCERVTRGEIRDALDSVIPPVSLHGLQRRTRALGGRCQGFYCGAEVKALLEAGTRHE